MNVILSLFRAKVLYFANSARTKLGSPGLECLQYHIHDLYKYEFWMLGAGRGCAKDAWHPLLSEFHESGKAFDSPSVDGSFDASARALSAVTVQSLVPLSNGWPVK
jgi:hypothetical protein